MTGVVDTVEISLLLDSPAIESAALGRIMLAGTNAAFSDRARAYSSAAELLADAEAQITSSDWEAVALAGIYSQARVPADVLVGRVDTTSFVAQDILVTIPASPPDGTYQIKINGIVQATFVASSSANTAIATDLVGDLNGGAEAAALTGTANGDGTLNIVSDTAGDGFTWELISPNGVMTGSVAVANHGWAEELTIIMAEEPDFHFVCTGTRSDAVIEDVAAWAETNKRLFMGQSSTAGILVPATTDDVLSKLKAQAYDRTALLYFSDGTEPAVESWVGRKGSVNPDVKSATWLHAQLIGITPDNLTTTQQGSVEDKNGNVYQKYAGVGATWEGKVVSGRFIDLMVTRDWLETRLAEDFQRFFLGISARDEKLTYTDEGIRRCAGVLRNRLAIGQTVGHLDPEVAPRVTPPLRASVADADVTAGLLTIPFRVQFASAIHKVAITGSMEVTLPT